MPTLLVSTAQIKGDKATAQVKVLFDTGASFSFVRREVAEISGTITKLPTPLRFILGDGRAIEITDTVVLALTLGNQPVIDNFLVLDTGVEDVVLGAATMRKFGLKIDLEHSAVYAALTQGKEMPMTECLKTLMTKLQMPMTEEMTDDQAIEQIVSKMQGQASAAPLVAAPLVASPAILALVELPATATEADLKGKLMALKNPGNVVPAAELLALKAQLHERDISATVNGALADRKLTPAEKAWGLEQAKADLPAFKAFVAHRPQQVPIGVTLPAAPAPGKGATDADAAERLILSVIQEHKTRGQELTYKAAAIIAAGQQPALFQLQ